MSYIKSAKADFFVIFYIKINSYNNNLIYGGYYYEKTIPYKGNFNIGTSRYIC